MMPIAKPLFTRVLLIACLSIPVSYAGLEPIVRVELDPETVSVGQAARLRVTVLVPTWFTTPPVYPNFELVNAITRLPPNSSFPTNERVDGENWSGIVRDYQIYPQSAGTYPFPPQVMQVAFADPDTQKPTAREVRVPSFTLTGKIPHGAETLTPFLTSISLKLEQRIDGNNDSIETGDAVVRLVKATIVGMPAMFLPPLIDASTMSGVSIYLKDAVLDEKTGNWDDRLTSTRTESATYVFEHPGDYSLPGVELRWWNSDTGTIESTSIPATIVSVRGDIPQTTQNANRPAAATLRALFALSLVLVVGFIVVRRFGPDWTQWLRSRLRERRESERYAFKRLLETVQQGHKAAVYRSTLAWLARTGANFNDLPACWGEPDYDLKQLAVDVYQNDAKTPTMSIQEKQALKRSLKSIRHSLSITRAAGEAKSALPAMNP